MSEMIIQSGKLKGKRLVLPEKEMVVGRDDDCDLRIASSLVSRKHCILKSSAAGILVTDLDSQNGTYVNDLAITEPTLLSDGDVVRIGALLLEVPVLSKPKMTFGHQQSAISDNEIAGWLTESAPNVSGSDTAVIAKAHPVTPAPASKPTTPVTPVLSTVTPALKPAPPAPPAKQLSVKDEATAVIRKHWETIKAKKQN